MEPLVTKALTETGSVLGKEAESFLSVVLGDPAKALSGLFADRINARRHKNLVIITIQAKQLLMESGLSPKEVPLKIIHPLLEAASLEEDPDIQTMWAKLLASTAKPGDNPFAGAFVEMLRQLSSAEAHFLKLLDAKLAKEIAEFNASPEPAPYWHPTHRIGNHQELEPMVLQASGDVKTGENDHQVSFAVAVALGNLVRLGVLKGPGMGRPSYSMEPFGLLFLDTCCGENQTES